MSASIPVHPADRGERWHNPTVAEVIEQYLLHGQREMAAYTRADGERILRIFMAAYGSLRLNDARPYHLVVWVESQKQLRSDWSLYRWIGVVQRAFNWAAKMGLIAYNPFFGAQHRKGTPGRALTEDEWRACLRHSNAIFRRFLIFLAFTGCRPGEASSAKWSDVEIDPDAGVAYVTLKTHKTAKATRRPRVITCVGPVVKLLVWLQRRRPPCTEHVFLNARGRPWSRAVMSYRLSLVRKATGLPADARLYGLRHAWATNAILRGTPIKAVATLLGHTSTRITEAHYVHVAGNRGFLADAARQALGNGTASPRDNRPPAKGGNRS